MLTEEQTIELSATDDTDPEAAIVCWRSGEVTVVDLDQVPNGTLTLAIGQRSDLQRALSAVARHAYDGRTLLIPGVPEADDNNQQAWRATKRFEAALLSRLRRRAVQ